MGARWYDPTTGTFQSIDPVFEQADPQQQNGYTYAAANPVTGSDPTGLCDPETNNCPNVWNEISLKSTTSRASVNQRLGLRP